MPATKRLSISEFHRLVAVSEPAGGEEALPRGPSGDVGRRAVPGTRRWISKGDGDMQLVVSELAVPEGSGAPVVETVEGFKQAFDLIVDEYLNGFDASEACRCVLELQAPQFHFQVVKRGVLRAMDEADRERELIAILLSCLHERGTLTAEQVAAGFRAILADLDDLTIDMPTATPLLAHFLADAVLDGLLPRAELARWAADFSAAPAAAAALDGAALRLGGHRGGAETSPGEVAAVRREVGSVVEEYLCSHDVAEVRRRLGEMSLPAELQHNVVRVAGLAVGLVQRMVTEEVLSPEQLCLGRQRAAEGREREEAAPPAPPSPDPAPALPLLLGAEDLRLDNPRAPELIADFLERLPG
ncbi:hypothetical protein EMIHUDRAFT_106249 [Emiliania huxleyi CCMP1516]|uniref:MI domain-containing protein n=2 Tax=Emiliania huxleyi TaxID=2903 RepID=A0A0D3IAE2_EMIH1|nr:hypothetical protein EMIHUDRAFT_106249 [Emiliania huxleyi CCMP1516]EOD08227.1 hypothetical protein EMIHUDRAFT_106249 [Emiliania huxleyi CCMP1516]|eukprot:XP_005760656.1 hypothetical protein EMIHUDRAFT_106249 [Emiliania huxleyi CCMP1516]